MRMARNVFCYSSQGERGNSKERRGWQRQRSPLPPAGVPGSRLPPAPLCPCSKPQGGPDPQGAGDPEQSRSKVRRGLSLGSPLSTPLCLDEEGKGTRKEAEARAVDNLSSPTRFQTLLLLGCMWAPCWDPARGKDMSSGNGKYSQRPIPLLWDKEITPFRTCHLFLTWALGLTHCCSWSYKRRVEGFACSKASVSHWTQDGLGRFLIPGMWLFIDPNPGNKMTWLTSILR